MLNQIMPQFTILDLFLRRILRNNEGNFSPSDSPTEK